MQIPIANRSSFHSWSHLIPEHDESSRYAAKGVTFAFGSIAYIHIEATTTIKTIFSKRTDNTNTDCVCFRTVKPPGDKSLPDAVALVVWMNRQ